jgi:D-amino-acid dehydrogenase
MVAQRDDILIVGAGVIGLSCALELLKAGRGVTLLDAGRPGGGSSHGNCGTITPSHATPLAAPGVIAKALGWMWRPDAPLYVKPRFDPALAHWLMRFAARCNERDYRASSQAKAALLVASRELLGHVIRDEGLDCEFTACGSIYVYRDRAALDAAAGMIARLHELGVRADLLDGAALAREEPALQDGMAGGVLFPGDAALRPDRLVAELARRVRERGGNIAGDCAVESIVRGRDGRIEHVVAGGVPHRAGDYVLAAGAWSPRVARELGFSLPVQPGKGYSITYSRPAQVPRRPLVLRERSVCVTAWDSGYRLGSTMEFSGYDDTLNRVRLDALPRAAAEYLRDPVGAEKREEWFGWRPMTWDDLPILGRAPGIPNLALATGHGMLGVSMSSITGRLIADLVTGREPGLDLRPYSAQRFS